MKLPFSETQFLDVFAAYNASCWPVVLMLWAASLFAAVQLLRGRAKPALISALLGAHWLWSGVVYHALFFTSINPAAWLFGLLFAIEGAMFIWLGVVHRVPAFHRPAGLRGSTAAMFIACALLYPVLVALSGHTFPRAPAFALPCPTTLFTAGVLLTATPAVPWWLLLIPVAWSFVGGSAALTLGMTPDLMLFAAAVVLALPVLNQFLKAYN